MMRRKRKNFHREQKSRSLTKDRESEWHRFFNSRCRSVTKACPSFCDPMDCSMPGFLFLHYLPEFAQIMSTESVMPSNHLILCCPLLPLSLIFSSIRVKVLDHVQLFETPWTVAHQAPLSTGFSRQEYWSGLPCPPPGVKKVR